MPVQASLWMERPIGRESGASRDSKAPAPHARPPAPAVDGNARWQRLALRRHDAGAPGLAPPSVYDAISSGGRPLEGRTRRYFEPRLGVDLSSVRVHDDPRAAESARAVSARAYALGADVVFAAGEYRPGTTSGDGLIAHELAHVAQADAATGEPPLRLSDPGEASERAAEGLATDLTSPGGGRARRHVPAAPGVVHRREDTEARRVRELKANYEAAVKQPDWKRAAVLLNGFSDDDIQLRLRKLDLPSLRAISAAAESEMPGWSGRVTAPADKLIAEIERVATLKANYAAAIRKPNPDWKKAAVLLNGFNDADILIRLTLLNTDDLRALDRAAREAMPGWSDRVVLPIARLLAPFASSAPPGDASRSPSAGSFAAPSAEKLAKMSERSRAVWQKFLDTRDAQAREYGAVDYEDYVRNMLVAGGNVLGRRVPASAPVHPLFLDRLEAASAAAESAIGSREFGITGFGGQSNRPGYHAWGLAIDIDSAANPYVINESGEAELDKLVAPVYDRIAKALLHRDSVLTRPASRAEPTKLQGASYDAIAAENDAMVAYFSVLPAPEAPRGQPRLQTPRAMSSVRFAQEDLDKLDRDRVQADYDLLLGRKAVDADGKATVIDDAWRKQSHVTGDFPFAGGGPGLARDPARGFLAIRKEVVEALRGAGFRWGAVDFYSECGDVMHFDDGKAERHKDYVQYGKDHPTSKRQAESADL